MKTRATKDGNGYVLNGAKRFITNAPTANVFTVMARTNPEEKGARGVIADRRPERLPRRASKL